MWISQYSRNLIPALGFNSNEFPATHLDFKRSYLCCVLEEFWFLVLKQLTTDRVVLEVTTRNCHNNVKSILYKAESLKISCGLGKFFLWSNLHMGTWTALVKAKPALGPMARFLEGTGRFCSEREVMNTASPCSESSPIAQVMLWGYGLTFQGKCCIYE